MSVVLETSIGDLTVDLYLEQRPICCLNFLKLCKMKYFNFNLVFSVQRKFVAQMGDPTGTGRGGASVFKYVYGDQATYFDAEMKPRIKHTKAGMLSMVNNGSNQHGSQFFITLAPDLDYLDTQQHTVFGEVAEGFEVLEKLNEIIADKENRPYKDIRIFHTVVLDDPLKDPPGLEEHIPDRSPTPTKEQLDSIRIGVDEDVDDEKGRKPEELEEVYKEKEAKAAAQILEMIGDLPEADVKPPDNVLFVCKLNPVTSAEDLEIIFSRFGEISSCEVIKDTKTNESLQYAFIEFKNVEDCEKAYFKMDNVLIDDRRIHVDFSQSVSKIKWKGKGKGVERMKEEKEVTQPQFRIKDPDKRVINDKYGYVFEDDEDDRVSSKSAKKKHERNRSRSGSVDKSKVRRSRSSSSSKRHRDKKAKRKHGHSDKHRASRSNSPDRRSNSGSPHEHKKKKERRQDGHDDRKDRSERHAAKSKRRSCSPKHKSEDSKHKKHKHQDKERRR